MWTLTVLTGYCMGVWCTVDYNKGFPSWDACNAERAAIIAADNPDDDTVIVVKCTPTKL
ncbi:hypothetical protein phiGT1_68 [Sulfitobacter phage phiGT1]|nr:hypothetical protein phiGT1_68 [Sulfitobacter phage phiGT1]